MYSIFSIYIYFLFHWCAAATSLLISAFLMPFIMVHNILLLLVCVSFTIIGQPRAPEAIGQVWRSPYQSWTLMGGAIPIILVKIFKMLRILISKCNNFRYFCRYSSSSFKLFETQINVMRNCVKRNKYGRKSRTNLLLFAYVPPPML